MPEPVMGTTTISSVCRRFDAARSSRAAVAVVVDALFFEVHDDPDTALCDGPNQLYLDRFPRFVDTLLALDRCVRPN